MALGLAAGLLAGCGGNATDLGEFNGNGVYTQAQKRAIGNCLDLARRSARSYGYQAPRDLPQQVERSGENDFAITWKFAAAPRQYQCIVSNNGTAHKYFWG